MHQRSPLSAEELVVLLHQSSSALMFLHGGQPGPLAHGKIKPQNIFVQNRDHSNPLYLRIKLSEFGFSRIYSKGMPKASSYRGTYCPPKLFVQSRQESPRTVVKVDIWSLGVVLLEIAFGLPFPGGTRGQGINWCERIAGQVLVSQKPRDGSAESFLMGILPRMLVFVAEARCSAGACWSEASQLLASLQGHDIMPALAREALPASGEPYEVCLL